MQLCYKLFTAACAAQMAVFVLLEAVRGPFTTQTLTYHPISNTTAYAMFIETAPVDAAVFLTTLCAAALSVTYVMLHGTPITTTRSCTFCCGLL